MQIRRCTMPDRRQCHSVCSCRNWSAALLGVIIFTILVDRGTSNPVQTWSIDCPTSSTQSSDVASDDTVSRTFAARFVIDGQLVRFIDVESDAAAAGSTSTPGQRRRVNPTEETTLGASSWTGEFRIKGILKKQSKGADSEGATSVGGSATVGSLVTVTSCTVPSGSSAARMTVGGRYVVFVGNRLLSATTSGSTSSSPRYLSLGFPEKYTKKVVQLVKENTCTDCGSPPAEARLSPRSFHGKFGHPVELVCRSVGGRPSPVITWYKDNEPLTASQHIEISSRGARGSQLSITDALTEDAGLYSCRATNIFGFKVSLTSTVAIATPTETKKQYASLCPSQHYCLNQGTCYQLTQLNITYCECDYPWSGTRCMTYHVEPSKPKDDETLTSTAMSGLVTILAMALCILIVGLLSWTISILRSIQRGLHKQTAKTDAHCPADAHSQTLPNGGCHFNRNLPTTDIDFDVPDGKYATGGRRTVTSSTGSQQSSSNRTTASNNSAKTDRRSRKSAVSETPEPPPTPDVERTAEVHSSALSGSLFAFPGNGSRAPRSINGTPPNSRAPNASKTNTSGDASRTVTSSSQSKPEIGKAASSSGVVTSVPPAVTSGAVRGWNGDETTSDDDEKRNQEQELDNLLRTLGLLSGNGSNVESPSVDVSLLSRYRSDRQH